MLVGPVMAEREGKMGHEFLAALCGGGIRRGNNVYIALGL